MTTQNGARRSCTWARRIISDYIFRVAQSKVCEPHVSFLLVYTLKYYITLSFLANNNMDDSTFILSSIVSMTDDSIWTLHLFDCESPKRLQLKEAAYHT